MVPFPISRATSRRRSKCWHRRQFQRRFFFLRRATYRHIWRCLCWRWLFLSGAPMGRSCVRKSFLRTLAFLSCEKLRLESPFSTVRIGHKEFRTLKFLLLFLVDGARRCGGSACCRRFGSWRYSFAVKRTVRYRFFFLLAFCCQPDPDGLRCWLSREIQILDCEDGYTPFSFLLKENFRLVESDDDGYETDEPPYQNSSLSFPVYTPEDVACLLKSLKFRALV
ncbi:hypothetical protein HPP92_025016 [Vanilla planifolia]|uniref:Uncharacterized protein n=1 Tax=Vanilla planifolia TaxID=51239 RepID=A0A835PLE9_VANPL|nr:hypothetical protein HPP92_025016 [Vanilla planifolia]